MGASVPGQNSLKFLAIMIRVCSENLYPDCLGNRDWQRIFGHKQRELSIAKCTKLVLVGYRDLATTFRGHGSHFNSLAPGRPSPSTPHPFVDISGRKNLLRVFPIKPLVISNFL